MLKLPIFILLWIGMMMIKFVIAVLGLFTIAYMWKWRNTPFNEVPKWTTPWLNPEDWHGTFNHYVNSLPRWWVQLHGANFKSFWHYHAIRNPANGLRNIEWLDLDNVPEKVKYHSPKYYDRYEPSILRQQAYKPGDEFNPDIKTCWYLAWQGWQAGFKIVHIWNDERHLVIKIGWRVEPANTKDRDRPQVLIDDASFASKILIWRKG